MLETINAYLVSLYENVTLEFVFKFLVVYFFIIWIALIVWVMKDISIRTNNIFFQLFCILIILLLTPLGVFIYLLVRPGKTLYERYYDEIDLNLDIMSEIVEERKKLMEKENKIDKTLEIKKAIKDNSKQKKSKDKQQKGDKKKKTEIKVKNF